MKTTEVFVIISMIILVVTIGILWRYCDSEMFTRRLTAFVGGREHFSNDERAMTLLRTPGHPFTQLVVRDWPEKPGHIFLSIASFQDERCKLSIQSAFKNAEDPSKIVIGICEQNAHVSDACCTESVSAGEVRMISIPAGEATGPCTARQRVSTLWRGEEIYCQVDAAHLFLQGVGQASVGDVASSSLSFSGLQHLCERQ